MKNPNEEEVTVTATLYRPSGAQITSVNHAIGPHAVEHVEVGPHIFPDGMGNITFTYEAKCGLVGSVVQAYKKTAINRVVLQGDGLQRVSAASGSLSVPHYYTVSSGGQDWETWYILKNPGSAQVNVGVTYYDLDGDEIFPTPVPTLAIPAHGNAVRGLTTGQMQPAQGSIEFRAQNEGKILGRFEIIGKDYDATYPSVVIGSDELQPDEGTALVHWAPYFESQASPLIGTYVTVRNPSASATVDVSVFYFDEDGEEIAAQGTARPASFELEPHAARVISPDQDESLATGSVMIVADGYVNGMVERFRLLDSLYPNDFDFEVSALVPVE